MNEEWRDVVGCPDYRVSNLGRVYSVRRGIIMKPWLDTGGYFKLRIRGRLVFVHRLVMAAFVGLSELDVNHKNFVRHDNRLENLEYMTTLENARYSAKAGRLSGRQGLSGENSTKAKLTWVQVAEIREAYSGGGVTQRQLAKQYGITQQTVCKVVTEETWKTR